MHHAIHSLPCNLGYRRETCYEYEEVTIEVYMHIYSRVVFRVNNNTHLTKRGKRHLFACDLYCKPMETVVKIGSA